MPRTLQQNKVIKDKRRNEILNAALELFVKNGFDTVSMDDIAKKIKCSHGLIYHYYTNKKDILVDLGRQSHDVIGIDYNSIINLPISFFDKYLKIQEYLLDIISSNNLKRYYLFLFLTLPLNKSLSEDLIQPTLRFEVKLTKIIRECQKEGHFLNIEPKELIIIEGIMALVNKDLRSLGDLKVYINASRERRLVRRIERDQRERGRTYESIIEQYFSTVLPMYEEIIAPSQYYADIIINNDGYANKSIDILVSVLKMMLEDK